MFLGIFFLILNSVHVPEVVDKLSTKRLLTMSWLEGDPILKYKNEKKEIRNIIAKNMFYAWYKPFYEYGIIHGDPHLGNYSIYKKTYQLIYLILGV